MQDITTEQIADIVAAHSGVEGALLPVLHAVQEQAGYIPAKAVPLIAEGLRVSRAEIQGVISFYHDFKEHPQGRHTVQVCRSESCQAMGGAALENTARESLGIDFHETADDGSVSLEAVYCFGNCACSPAVRIDDQLYGRIDSEHFGELLKALD